MSQPDLTLRSVSVHPVEVPMTRPLRTGGGAVSSAPLVLVEMHADQGVSGCGYLFAYTPVALSSLVHLLHSVAEALAGTSLAPFELESRLRSMFRLVGPQGLTGMVAAVLDMAAWDMQARALELPLVRLLGGAPRPVQAYNSCGLGLRPIDEIKRLGGEAVELAERGFSAVKLRLGYPHVAHDLAALASVREALPGDALIMSDYNQCLSVADAERRVEALSGEGLYWIEEPTRADDYAGHARVRAVCDTRIQLGENAWGVDDMAKALEAGACDCFMPDVGKIGGVSGWMRAAALAAPRGMPVSSHLYPEISAHLMPVTVTAHWLEYVDWASPVLQEPLVIEDGTVTAPARPGNGMSFDREAVERFAV